IDADGGDAIAFALLVGDAPRAHRATAGPGAPIHHRAGRRIRNNQIHESSLVQVFPRWKLRNLRRQLSRFGSSEFSPTKGLICRRLIENRAGEGRKNLPPFTKRCGALICACPDGATCPAPSACYWSMRTWSCVPLWRNN